jgi:hypothetical protein
VNWLKGGYYSTNCGGATFTHLSGHNANLPDNAGVLNYSGSGVYSLSTNWFNNGSTHQTYFDGSIWRCDNNAAGATHSTHHQIWAR